MMVLVTYDVNVETSEGKRRLRNVAKVCKNYGQRVQNSVFECLVDPARWVVFRQELIDIVKNETDSLRFYFLGSNWKRKVEHIGAKQTYDPEGLMMV
jgi:CRISPR-associated protein Cas2